MIQENIISTLTDTGLDAFLNEEHRLVLAWFSASWCGPCKRMEPVLRTIGTEWFARLKIGCIDVEKCPQLAQRFQIKALPSFLLFKNGQLVAQRAAVMTPSQLKEFIEQPV